MWNIACNITLAMAIAFGTSGCAQLAVSGLAMAANIGAAGAIGKSAAARKADRCYQVDKKTEGMGNAERDREKRIAGCMS